MKNKLTELFDRLRKKEEPEEEDFVFRKRPEEYSPKERSPKEIRKIWREKQKSKRREEIEEGEEDAEDEENEAGLYGLKLDRFKANASPTDFSGFLKETLEIHKSAALAADQLQKDLDTALYDSTGWASADVAARMTQIDRVSLMINLDKLEKLLVDNCYALEAYLEAVQPSSDRPRPKAE